MQTQQETQAKAQFQLSQYGYLLSAVNEIVRFEDNKPMGVFLKSRGVRMYAVTATGAKLWTGVDMGKFVERFWLAKRIG